jgi:sarcosine oxidase
MRVVVVGCGAIGAASALALARAGHAVTVLDHLGPANALGSSHGRARIFRLAYDDPHYVELAQRALPRWRKIERLSGASLLTTTGGVDHGDAASVAMVREATNAAGAQSQMVPAAEALARWPGLRFESDVHVDPLAGRLDAEGAVRAMLGLAVAAGATLREERALAVTGERVTTDAGKHDADAVVVAAGAWAAKLVPALAPPVVTVEQPVHLAATSADWPSFIHHPPPEAGVPFVYGLFEPGAGVKLGEHGGGRTVDPDDPDRTPEAAGIARLIQYARRWLPGVDAESALATGCLYDSTASHDFVIDRAPGGVIVAAGTSGHGFKFAPELGALVREVAEGGAPHPRFALHG